MVEVTKARLIVLFQHRSKYSICFQKINKSVIFGLLHPQRMETRPQCFLIDDDPDDQEIFLMALSEVDKNIRCTVAADGIQALQTLSGDPDFVPGHIFLDVNMPRMNGLECLEKIRQLGHLSDTKIIMYSTSADPRVISSSRELGASEYLVKPHGFSSLVQTLTKIFYSKS
jgi:CheY-like chemotaxis protein